MVLLLDKFKLLLESGDELLFLFDLILRFLNEMFWGSADVVGVIHAKIEGIKFTTNGENALGESIFVFLNDFFGDVEVEFVICQSETKASWAAF